MIHELFASSSANLMGKIEVSAMLVLQLHELHQPLLAWEHMVCTGQNPINAIADWVNV